MRCGHRRRPPAEEGPARGLPRAFGPWPPLRIAVTGAGTPAWLLAGFSGALCSGSPGSCSRGRSEPPQEGSASPEQAPGSGHADPGLDIQSRASHSPEGPWGGGQGLLPTPHCSGHGGSSDLAQECPGCPWRAAAQPGLGALCPKRCGYIVMKPELTKFGYCVLRRCFPLDNLLHFYVTFISWWCCPQLSFPWDACHRKAIPVLPP